MSCRPPTCPDPLRQVPPQVDGACPCHPVCLCCTAERAGAAQAVRGSGYEEEVCCGQPSDIIDCHAVARVEGDEAVHQTVAVRIYRRDVQVRKREGTKAVELYVILTVVEVVNEVWAVARPEDKGVMAEPIRSGDKRSSSSSRACWPAPN